MPSDGTTLDDPIVRRLEEGKQVILNQGWCQYIRVDGLNRVCLLGAYTGNCDIETVSHTTQAAIEALQNLIPSRYGYTHPWSRVAMWNNEDGRTKEQVLELIDRAIATQRARALVEALSKFRS